MIRKITSFYQNCLSRRPHYAIEIWKRSFVSIIRPAYIHTNPSRKKLENAGLTFWCGWKTFWKLRFGKLWRYDHQDISLAEFSSSTNSKYLASFFVGSVAWHPNQRLRRRLVDRVSKRIYELNMLSHLSRYAKIFERHLWKAFSLFSWGILFFGQK